MINNKVFLKTKNNLIKINIAVVGSFLILFSVGIYGLFKSITYKNVDSYLIEELNNIRIQLEENSYIPPIPKDPKNMIYIYINGKIKYFTPNGYFKDIIPYKKTENIGFNSYKHNGFNFRELKFNIYEYDIQIIRSIDSEIHLLRQLLIVFSIGVLMSIIITYFIALYLTKKALIPIENSWENQVKFVQDASHELRTPVSIISFKIESILKKPNSTINDEIEIIADAMKETRRLKKMINDLLHLTKEDTITKLNISNINIEQLIQNICEDYMDIAKLQGKEFTYKNYSKCKTISTDKSKLKQLILIFIDNALKYTNHGDSVLIYLSESENNIVISVQDTGIGINSEEINLIFDRFFRSTDVRSKNIEGSGIGLSIAKMLMVNLKGDIKVSSKINEGTKFDLIIPKKIKIN